MGQKLGKQATPDLTIDQTRHSPNPLGVALAVVSIGLGQALITTDTVIGVLHDNAAARESGVVSHIFAGALFATRFLTWAEAQMVQFVDALIATVAHTSHAFWQFFKDMRGFQEFDVGAWAWHALGNINDFALGLEGASHPVRRAPRWAAPAGYTY